MLKSFEVVVIGAGPAGYIAAIRCAQLVSRPPSSTSGRTTRVKPSSAAPASTSAAYPPRRCWSRRKNYERVAYKFATTGFPLTGAKIDVAKMQARKDKIVSQLTGGIEFLFKKNKITWLKGHGKFAGSGEKYLVEVADGGSSETVEANHVVIATGSVARHLPGLAVDKRNHMRQHRRTRFQRRAGQAGRHRAA